MIAVEYLPFTDWDRNERPYPPEVEPLRLQAFPSHDTILIWPDGVYLITARTGGRTVGYALLEEPPRDWSPTDDEPEQFAYLAEVAVDEAHRGGGIGTALVQQVGRVVVDHMDHCDRILARFQFHDGQLERRRQWFRSFGFVPLDGPDDSDWVADDTRVAQGRGDRPPRR